MEKDRLFVNLRTWPFVDFQENGKRYEVRACGRQGFTEENVYNGRRVELRKAWNRGSLWGAIGEVLTGSIDEIFSSIDYRLVTPRASSKEEAVSSIKEMLNNPERYLLLRFCWIRANYLNLLCSLEIMAEEVTLHEVTPEDIEPVEGYN